MEAEQNETLGNRALNEEPTAVTSFISSGIVKNDFHESVKK